MGAYSIMGNTQKLVIHIGLHKTATTYLQYQLFPHLVDVRYIHGNDFFGQWQRQSGAANENLLLSYEGFTGLAWNRAWLSGVSNDFHWIDSFAANLKSLKLFFPNAILVVFFRKHGDILLSMYKQYVQEGGVLSLTDFFGANAVIRPEDLSFKARIETIEKYFPNSFFINYEEYKTGGDEYIKNFFLQEFNWTFQERKDDGKRFKANNSITGTKIEYLRSINGFYQKWPKKLRSTLRYIGWSPRDIFQERLAFWKPKDAAEFEVLRKKVNVDFKDDWEYFLLNQWVPSK